MQINPHGNTHWHGLLITHEVIDGIDQIFLSKDNDRLTASMAVAIMEGVWSGPGDEEETGMTASELRQVNTIHTQACRQGLY